MIGLVALISRVIILVYLSQCDAHSYSCVCVTAHIQCLFAQNADNTMTLSLEDHGPFAVEALQVFFRLLIRKA